MKKSIYKITNLINNKSYVGQSINPFVRFKQHCQKSCQHISLIHQAIQKYGKENFILEILEKDIEDYNEKEKYWIKKLNTLQPNGYNILEGGEYLNDIKEGEKNNLSLYTDEQFNQCILLLKENKKSLEEIESELNISHIYLLSVNSGTARSCQKHDGNKYPLKNVYTKIDEEISNLIIKDLQEKILTQKEIAKKYNISTSTMSGINQGKYWRKNDIRYPIREKRIKTRWGYY